MTDQLPAIIRAGAPTLLPDGRLIATVIAGAGERAAWRCVDFFTADIRNPDSRRADARAGDRFFAWCEEHGLALTAIRSFST